MNGHPPPLSGLPSPAPCTTGGGLPVSAQIRSLKLLRRTPHIARVNTVFDEEGKLLKERYLKRTEIFLGELLWMAKTLRHRRERIPSEVRA